MLRKHLSRIVAFKIVAMLALVVTGMLCGLILYRLSTTITTFAILTPLAVWS